MGNQQKQQRQKSQGRKATSSLSNTFQTRSFEPSFVPQSGSPQVQPQAETLSIENQEQQTDAAAKQQAGFDYGNLNISATGSIPSPSSPSISPLVQAKLTIGQPNDKYEQEADTVAKTVVQQLNSPPTAQRQAEIQSIPLTQSPLMRLPIQRNEGIITGPIGGEFETQLRRTRSGGSSLEPKVQVQMESAMGADFSGVKIHNDAKADQLSQSIQAKAFTTGQDVFFKQGEYNPSSRGGQALLAHELTHVMQQNSQTLQTQPDMLQRDTTQDVDDENFDYGDGLSEFELNQKVVLQKSKTLYSDETSKRGASIPLKKGDNNIVLSQGTLVKVIETRSRWLGYSWVKVETPDNPVGWINTSNAVPEPESGKIAEHEDAGVIMPNGEPTVEDVKQRMFGDCFLLASLSSLVERQPDFIVNELFQTDPRQPAQEHTIRFYEITDVTNNRNSRTIRFEPNDVTVKNSILKLQTDRPTSLMMMASGSNYGSDGEQAWPAVVEKAFALWPGKSSAGSISPSDSKTSLMEGGKVDVASMFLTGDEYYRTNLQFASAVKVNQRTNQILGPDQENIEDSEREKVKSEAEQQIVTETQEPLKLEIIAAFNDNAQAIIGAGTHATPPPQWLKENATQGEGGAGEAKAGGIVFGHAYSIVGADADKIQLRNPWGIYSRVNGDVKEDEAISVLSWDEFYQTFSEVSLKNEIDMYAL